jgi:ribonuclease E
MRREGRRRRRRGPKPEATAAADTGSEEASTPDVAEVVEATAPVETPTPEAAPEPAATPVASADEASDATEQQTPAAIQEATATQEVTETAKVGEPEAEEATPPAEVATAEPEIAAASTGITAEGRAINDPRVAPKPVSEVEIRSERGSLFAAEQAPALTPIDRNVPRASNDPRGPKAVDDNSATDAASGEEPVTEDLFQEAADR